MTEPVRSPYIRSVSGSGLVEAASENIAVATPLGGIVAEVFVKAGDRVEAGAPLFRIDDREYRAERTVRTAALAEAEAELARLRSLPRPEDVPPVESRVTEAEAEARDRAEDARRAADLFTAGAVGREQRDNATFAAKAAEARAESARAELRRLMAGAWAPELRAAEATVETARARLAAIDTDLDRLVVRAPIDGDVLSTSIRVGQMAHSGSTDTPLVLLGETRTLRLRVDIDENDAWRVRAGAPARAFLRGNPAIAADVDFLRIEPAVVPKRSLTGSNSERTDTRVLQVIFTVPRDRFPVYVGQLVEVRIDDTNVGEEVRS